MERKKWVHIFSIDKNVKKYLQAELQLLIGKEVKVTASALQDTYLYTTESIDPTIVITSGDFLNQEAKRTFPNSRILSMRRDINGKNLEKLIELPKGKKVLVVNHPKQASESTIESLMSMGFNHLEYLPFDREHEIDLTNIDTAISPSMMHLCPKGIKNKIDIGPRTISFSTLAMLLKILTLDLSYLDQYLYQYNRNITQMSFKLSEELMRSEELRRNFDILLDEMDDGIISINKNNSILYMNHACKSLLGLGNNRMKGEDIHDVLMLFDDHEKVIEGFKNFTKGIYSFNGKKVLIIYAPFHQKYGENNMIIMKGVDRLQKIEEDIRRILYKKGHTAKYSFKDIIGTSSSINKAINIAKKAAKSESTILITGESGTGKELLAQAIHKESLRTKSSFVAVNLASLPKSLVESELFGYSEGAFTGARKGGRIGLFEQAHKGTIFLDEIGDISYATQTSLLRVLQEKEVMRIGDNKIINIDIRFIAATNKDLKKLVAVGKFREDLYYRLNVLPIDLPPLRERKEDIQLLAYQFLDRFKSNKILSQEILDIFIHYEWRGNIRELINAIEYITQISTKNLITIEDLPAYLLPCNYNKGEDHTIQDHIYLPCSKGMTRLILKTLSDMQKECRKMSRKSLSDTLIKAGFLNITENKIRTILKHLELNGLVYIGKTKQGTIITEKGREYLGILGDE